MSASGRVDAKFSSRGVALYLVLAILLIVSILTTVLLSAITSQSKLSDHQVRRIQAYYAAQAGINYALESLRVNDPQWITDTASGKTLYMCRNQFACPVNPPNVTESSLPWTINYVKIYVGPLDPATGLRSVSASANYSSSF
ncbi:MAG: PilX N-terminal domain-containing pilus assembly protein [Deltaproteobacteria bacterium]